MRIGTIIAISALFAGATAAQAQHSHAGHAGHVSKRGAAGAAMQRSQTPATQEFMRAHHTMMRNMNQPYTGDPDADFRIQMIPHHQGAIDMARVALRHARDPWTRQLAEAIIVEQQREIYDMQNWLARRGYRAPSGGQPRHIIGWNSYRTLPENPGTLEESQSKSWAPGSGVPRQSGRP